MRDAPGWSDEQDELPDLETKVALAGTLHQAEVGGAVCFHSAITIAIITDGGGG